MIPLFKKLIFAFFYDEKAAARWLRGGLLFIGGMAVSILAYPFVVIREWTAQEWIYRVAAAGALGFAGTITAGDKNPSPEKLAAELGLPKPEPKP